MADNAQSPAKAEQHTPPNPTSQLEYPQLLIDASFESLLSHSHSSVTRTGIPMPRSEHSLSESWSSLSEHDLTRDLAHDDDLTSDVTDTGSLIDVSTAEDIHSVNDQGQSSDAEEDIHDIQGEGDTYNVGSGSEELLHGYGTNDFRPNGPNTYPIGSIRLEDSAVVVGPSGVTSLQASRVLQKNELLSFSTQLGANDALEDVMVTIKMSMSPEGLKVVKRPYNILFYGSPFTSSEIKSDVLGKIGAALISSSDHMKHGENSEPPCYHVVPSEFGPGSRPSTADLIPIPTQMHVTDCVVLDGLNKDRSDRSVRLGLSTGKTVTSREANLFETPSKRDWTQPDLVIVVISQNDDEGSHVEAEKVVEFANRHGIAILCLRQESGWDMDSFLTDAASDMLYKVVQSLSEHENDEAGRKMLLDVDMFRLLDTEQLSQHLNHLSQLASASLKSQSTLSQYFKLQLHKTCLYLERRLPFDTIQKLTASNEEFGGSQWIIETSSTHPERRRFNKVSVGKSILDENSNPLANMLPAFRDAIVSLLVTGLVVLLMYTSQKAVSRFMLAKTPTIEETPLSQLSAANCSYSIADTTAATVASSTTQSNALSGPLHALEQVQSWMELRAPAEKKVTEPKQHKDGSERPKSKAGVPCLDVMSAHIIPNLKVQAEFFESGEPAFDIQILRGNEKIHARVERQTNDVAAIMIKRKDFHGHLFVHLDGPSDRVCASINLENSLSETLTLWIQTPGKHRSKLRNAKELSNKYTRLLEVRTSKPGFVGSARELHYSAAQGIGAAVEAVEKTAIKHAKICHQDRNRCLVPSMESLTKDVSESVRHARQVSEDLIHDARTEIVERTRQARIRADEATQQVKGEVSKAVAAMQSSFRGVSRLGNVWPSKMTETLADAQQRAHKLVTKSKSGRRIGRWSRRG